MSRIYSVFCKKPPSAGTRTEVFYFIAPAAVALVQLYYIRSVHSFFQYLLPLPSWMAAAAVLPLLTFEYAATRVIELRRLGPGLSVWLPMAGRMLFLLILCALFFWYPVKTYGQPTVYAVLIGLWPFVAYITWVSSPVAAIVLCFGLAAFYWAFPFRRAVFRLISTVLLPGAGTLALFLLLYFYPEGSLSGARRPPKEVEKLFPLAGYSGPNMERWPEGAMFPHDLYVNPGDDWAAITFGPTFGDEKTSLPSFAWINLRRPEFRSFHGKSQARRFSSECQSKIYFSYWHTAYIVEYVPGAATVKTLPLPDHIASQRVDELFSVHNACDRIYATNNINPALFELDTHGKLLRSLSLTEAGLVGMGGQVAQLKRNPRRRTLLLSVYGRDPEARPELLRRTWLLNVLGVQPGRHILELDEKSFKLLNSASPSLFPMDLAVSPDGRSIYAPSAFTPEIHRLDAETLKTLEVISAPSHVRKIEFSLDGRYFYAGSYLTGEVVVYDAASSKKIGAFYVTPRVEALGATKKHLYIAGAGGLFRISNDKLISALSR